MPIVLAALSGCGLQAFNPEDPRRPPVEAPVTFTGRYRVSVLEILAETDTDGDGVVDNHLPEGLELIDFAVPESGFGLAAFNERLAEHVTDLRPIHLDVRVSDRFELDVLSSAPDADGVVQIDGGEITTLVGTLDGERFDAGPGDLQLDVVMADEAPSVPLVLLETQATGDLEDDRIRATLRTLISIDLVVSDVIKPSVPEEGWDVDRDGVLESKREVMTTVRNLAELLADDRLADGSPAISAVLALDAELAE